MTGETIDKTKGAPPANTSAAAVDYYDPVCRVQSPLAITPAAADDYFERARHAMMVEILIEHRNMMARKRQVAEMNADGESGTGDGDARRDD